MNNYYIKPFAVLVWIFEKPFTKVSFEIYKKNCFHMATVHKHHYTYENEFICLLTWYKMSLQKTQIFQYLLIWLVHCEIFHLFCLSKPVESRVMESLNSDILLFAILTSRVVCVSIRDWTSSVVGRTSSWRRREHAVPKTNSFRWK